MRFPPQVGHSEQTVRALVSRPLPSPPGGGDWLLAGTGWDGPSHDPAVPLDTVQLGLGPHHHLLVHRVSPPAFVLHRRSDTFGRGLRSSEVRVGVRAADVTFLLSPRGVESLTLADRSEDFVARIRTVLLQTSGSNWFILPRLLPVPQVLLLDVVLASPPVWS